MLFLVFVDGIIVLFRPETEFQNRKLARTPLPNINDTLSKYEGKA